MNRCFLVFFALLCSSYVHAQSSALHVMLSKGTLPAWVNTLPSKQLSIAKTEKKSQGYKLNKAMNDIMAGANDLQYKYLRTGELLFNDEASVFANEIALKLLKGNFALRHSLKICVAYTNENDITVCPNGLMVIDLGLFAQLENEDQLAFMISHELAHLRNGDLTTSEKPLEFETLTTDLLNYTTFRRERERLADSVGFEMYKEAGYEPGQVLRVFDVLEKNWLVPVQVPFDISLFTENESDYPDSLLVALDSCSPGVDDSKYYSSTQIEYLQRKSTMERVFNVSGKENAPLTASTEFASLNRLAIYNCGLNALQNKQTAVALYLGYYLHKTDSSVSDEVDLLIAKALYIHAALNCNEYEDNLSDIEVDENHGEYFANFSWDQDSPEPESRGYSAGSASFLDGLKPIELAILSIRWSWPYVQRTSQHKTLAEEIAGYSINMLNHIRTVSPDSVGNIRISNWIKSKKINTDSDDVQSEDEKKQEENEAAQLEEWKKRSEQMGIDISSQLDSVKKARARKRSKGQYLSREIVYYNSQLKSFAKDSAFISFYNKWSPRSAAAPLQPSSRTPMSKGDSIYLLTSEYYSFSQKPHANHLDYDHDKSQQGVETARLAVTQSGRACNVKVVAVAVNSDTLSLAEYNAYCIATRVAQEAMGYNWELYTYPIAFEEEFDYAYRATGIRHCMTDLTVVRYFTGGVTLSYRKTVGINLVTGNKDWVRIAKKKGGPPGSVHLHEFFHQLLRIK